MSGILYWIVVGLIAGWLAGRVMKGGGYGVVVDIILGILGGILGGWLFGMLHISMGGGLIGGTHRRLRRRGYSGMDHAVAEKSLTSAGVRPVNERAGFGLLKANRVGCRG